jgi:hypothetical protein
MSAAAAAVTSPERGVTRPRLLRALVLREVGRSFAPLLLLVALCSVAAAYEVYVAGGGGTPLTGRLLRRFDYTLLAVLVMLLVFRRASSIEMDHMHGWLAPFFAAGGSRWSYGAVSAATGLIVPYSLFALAAVSFAASVTVFSGSAELLHLLPRTLGGGLLLLGSFSVVTVAAGVVIRRAAAVSIVVAILVLVPLFLLVQFATSAAEPPSWSVVIQFLMPLVVPPPNLANVIRGIVYIALVGTLAAFLSHRYAGRTS